MRGLFMMASSEYFVVLIWSISEDNYAEYVSAEFLLYTFDGKEYVQMKWSLAIKLFFLISKVHS